MSSNSSHESELESVFVALSLCVVGFAVFSVILVPLLWVAVEFVRFTQRKRENEFRLTEEEYKRASQYQHIVDMAERSLIEAERIAQEKGLTKKQNGEYDRRFAGAKEVVQQIQEAQSQKTQAEPLYKRYIEGPQRRFNAWALPIQVAWVTRVVLVSWALIAFLNWKTLKLALLKTIQVLVSHKFASRVS